MYRFTARSSAPVQYLDSDAKRLLKIIGKPTAAPGIITKTQTADAISALEAAIVHEQQARENTDRGKSRHDDAGDDGHAQSGDEKKDQAPPVPLRNRALPLMQLLRSALQAGEDVIWDGH